MSTTENTNTQTEVSNRVATMIDGTKVNFGSRNNLITSFDTDTGVITFKVFTGEIQTLNVGSIAKLAYESMTDLAKTVVLHGYLNKIKANLAPVKLQEEVEEKDEQGQPTGVKTVVNSLAIAIGKEISKLLTGDYPIRGTGSDEDVTLTLEHKAFAETSSKIAVFRKAFGISDEVAAGWTDLENSDTISSILDVWTGYTRSERLNIKKNPYFNSIFSALQIQELEAQAETAE